MIVLEDVTKMYDSKLAVDGLSLTVEEGQVCVLIGPSGCGKTTTLRMINRLVEPTKGRILVGGVDTSTMSVEELRRGLGYAIQSVGLFPHLTVEDNIGVVPKLLGWEKTRIHSRVLELLALVGLDPDAYARKYPRKLSGGEAQRVGVARALAADPPVLLMDEPFGAVDPLTRERLQAEFSRIQRDLRKTVVLVTHDIDEAIRLADKIAVMREGRLMQYDAPEVVLESPANKFVHDFVGTDAALKRLVRVPVASVMRADVETVRLRALWEARGKAASARRFVYVVEDGGVLCGWVDTRDLEAGLEIEDALTRIDASLVGVAPDTSLKDALSRMLGLGFRSVPVVDSGCRLLGEVSFDSISAVMADGAGNGGAPVAGGDDE